MNICSNLFIYDTVILTCCGFSAGFVPITVDRRNFKYFDDCILKFSYVLRNELILVFILSG